MEPEVLTTEDTSTVEQSTRGANTAGCSIGQGGNATQDRTVGDQGCVEQDEGGKWETAGYRSSPKYKKNTGTGSYADATRGKGRKPTYKAGPPEDEQRTTT